MPADVLIALVSESVTGLTAVPALYAQLVSVPWPTGTGQSLRYFASTGGRMPRAVLASLCERLPNAAPFLMYGLTEAFRSTYLPPEELARRPDSIGRAIPNAEVLVLRQDGQECEAGEPGELVHRGPLVAQGYWGDAAHTAERFKPLPEHLRPVGAVLGEVAVYSGDTVTRDVDGFLYFVARRDELIKTSGYRVSPSEVEEVLYACRAVIECAVYGVEHATLGQVVHASVVLAADAAPAALDGVLEHCRRELPGWMVPAHIQLHRGSLPRSPNGKIDRRLLSAASEGPG
jgi:acyl-CoA synthetase (AMP-forming)/AMP-acid ligase II